MKISYSHSSGWLPTTVFEVDTDTLPQGERQQLETLVFESGILSCDGECDLALRDGDEYTIEISTQDLTHTWLWYGAGRPEGPVSLVSLLAYLNGRSARKP